ncbi:hypothetical protein BDW22DRAFT_1259728 [Trametopsis cervina]|nr:hypothetical protein BDW22DRAFT_1259728 [Trametopsis cervina]
MARRLSSSFVVAALAVFAAAEPLENRARDSCVAIAGQKWVAPKDVRACYTSFQVQADIKSNILEVVNKTLAFHTSVNYEFRAPAPFTNDVHEDVLGDLARIGYQHYPSDLDFHIDLSRSVKRLNDGHCVYINSCYDSAFITYLPTPLVLLTDAQGRQNVHIAPEAFTVASTEFADQIQVWQDALPGLLKGQLASLSGAKVLLINGADPFVAVNANAQIAGSFQALGTRQNGFFASYQRATSSWNYVLGNFAQQSLPLTDSVVLTILRSGHILPDTIILPYRSRIGSATVPFTDSASFRQNNCVAIDGTNGVNAYASDSSTSRQSEPSLPPPAAQPFRQSAPISRADARKYAVNALLDSIPLHDVALPPALAPTNPISGSTGVSQFYILDDGKTGVLALGSFSAPDFNTMIQTFLAGLQGLKAKGATQLIVDVTNNSGGFICAAHWLHRLIVGSKSTSFPQAGLNTTARAGPLAQLLSHTIATNASADPDRFLLYNPLHWFFPNNTEFAADFDWLGEPVRKVVNGRQDAFSLTLSDGCLVEPFPITPPAEALFDSHKVVIVNNGRCASSCALFSITMAKEEGTKTVVIGGKQGVQQQYAGTVGGQSTDFSRIDTEIKTALLKDHPLAPPDFKTNSVQGITWRLGYGIQDPTQPEEWQNHPADVNLPLTLETVNNPVAIWKQIAKTLLA